MILYGDMMCSGIYLRWVETLRRAARSFFFRGGKDPAGYAAGFPPRLAHMGCIEKGHWRIDKGKLLRRHGPNGALAAVGFFVESWAVLHSCHTVGSRRSCQSQKEEGGLKRRLISAKGSIA